MVSDRQNGYREGQIWNRVRGWGRQGCGRDPVEEEVTELEYGRELFVVDGSRNISYGTWQKVECMDYAVGGRHGRLGEIAVEEFNCIEEKKMLGDGIDNVETPVVLHHRGNVKTLTAVEVP